MLAFAGAMIFAIGAFLVEPMADAWPRSSDPRAIGLFRAVTQFSGVVVIAFALVQFYLEFGSIDVRSIALGPVRFSGATVSGGSSSRAPSGAFASFTRTGRTTRDDDSKDVEEDEDEDEGEGDTSPSLDEPSELSARLAERLEEEIEVQGRRANTNLSLGIIAALTGIAILGWLSFSTSNELQFSVEHAVKEINYMLYWGSFTARLTLSIAANVFAFFFFASYRRSLSEVRYFHNELTNIQARFVAVGLTNTGGPADLRKLAIKSLIDIERNFVLRRGETTAEVAMREHDRDDVIAFAQLLSSLNQAPPVQARSNAQRSSSRITRRKS